MRIVRNFAALTLVLALALASQLASAFMDPPVLVTTNPVPGQPVLISINVGDCDAITTDPIQIARAGNDILMVLPTIHSISDDFCIYPTGVVTLVVGTFALGSYSLQVERAYIGDVGPTTVPLGTLAFVVAAPESVPALSLSASMVLITLFLTLAFAVFHPRRSRVPPNYSFKRTAAMGCGTIMRRSAAAA